MNRYRQMQADADEFDCRMCQHEIKQLGPVHGPPEPPGHRRH